MDATGLIKYFEGFNGIDLLALIAIGSLGFFICRQINREAIRAHKELAYAAKLAAENARAESTEVTAKLSDERQRYRAIEAELLAAKSQARIAQLEVDRQIVGKRIDALVFELVIGRLGLVISLFQAFHLATMRRECPLPELLESFPRDSTNVFVLANKLGDHLTQLRRDTGYTIGALATDNDPIYDAFDKSIASFTRKYHPLADFALLRKG